MAFNEKELKTLAQGLLENKLLVTLNHADKNGLDFDGALAAARVQYERIKRIHEDLKKIG